MHPLYITRAGLIGTLVVLGIAALCVRLGFWQLDRLDQRRARNAAIAERIHLDPLPLASVTDADTAGILYRRVALRGRFDHARSVILPGRSHMGRTGAHLVTPLRLDEGGAVLVNRGWFPAVDPTSVDLSAFSAIDGTVRLEAVLLPYPSDLSASSDEDGEEPVRMEPAAGPTADEDDRDAAFARIHYRIDPNRIGASLPYPIFGAYARAVAELDDGRDHPIALSPPPLDDGPHMSYAIQWFSFATIALVGWIVLALRRGELGRRSDRGAADERRSLPNFPAR